MSPAFEVNSAKKFLEAQAGARTNMTGGQFEPAECDQSLWLFYLLARWIKVATGRVGQLFIDINCLHIPCP